MMPEENDDQDGTGNSEASRGMSLLVQWFFLSAVIAVGLGVLGGMLPSRVKLLGIFAVLQSLLLAFVVANLHRSFLLELRRPFFFAVGVLIAIQSATSFWISFRDYTSSIEQQQKEDSNASSLAKIVRSENIDPKVQEEFQKAKDEKEAKLQFPAYLKHRVSQLGDWSSPWPELFAGMEVLASVFFGLVVSRLNTKKISH